MNHKINVKSLEWWYWFSTLIAMIVGLSGYSAGFYVVIAISTVQFLYFMSVKGFSAFPTQVRLVYGIFIAVAYFDPTYILYYLLLVGTVMVTIFDSCFIARVLVLMPWNKEIKLSQK